MVHLHGRDMLSSKDVLTKLANIYNNNIWLTFGSFLYIDASIPIDENDIESFLTSPRTQPLLYSHLQTSYTWLFKKIHISDLKYNAGFIQSATDMAMILPMIEMAGKERVKYIPEITYIARVDSNSNKIFQTKMENYIKSLPKYSLLAENYDKYQDKTCENTDIIDMNNMPDQIYIINLDQATRRWDIINEKLNCAGLNFTRFSATDGYKIKITSFDNNEEFFGADIKNKKNYLAKDHLYKITCNPEDPNQIQFNFRGFHNWKKEPVSAGELGLWCSNIKIWKDAKNHEYNKILVFEDDITPAPNFKENLSNFIANLPSDFDIAYLGMHLETGVESLVPVNEYIQTFSNNSLGWGAYAILYSKKAIDKLLDIDEYTYAIDTFYWCLGPSKVSVDRKFYQECLKYPYTLETYYTTIKLLNVERIYDETSITAMGRDLGHTLYDL